MRALSKRAIHAACIASRALNPRLWSPTSRHFLLHRLVILARNTRSRMSFASQAQWRVCNLFRSSSSPTSRVRASGARSQIDRFCQIFWCPLGSGCCNTGPHRAIRIVRELDLSVPLSYWNNCLASFDLEYLAHARLFRRGDRPSLASCFGQMPSAASRRLVSQRPSTSCTLPTVPQRLESRHLLASRHARSRALSKPSHSGWRIRSARPISCIPPSSSQSP
jgi:hypothetical protein